MPAPTISVTDPVAPLQTLFNVGNDALEADIAALAADIAAWQTGYGRVFKFADTAALQAGAPSPSFGVGDLAAVTTMPTGILRHFWAFQQGGPVFVPVGTIQASSKTNMDSYITLVSGMSRLNFQPGAFWYDNGTGMTYRFTASTGAYVVASGQRTVFSRAAASLASGTSGVSLAMATTVLTAGTFTQSSGVFTCVVPGTYKITLSLNFAASASGTRTALLLHSDTTLRSFQLTAVGASDETLTVTWIKAFTAAQTVTVQGQQNSGSGLNVQGEIEFERVV